MITEAGIPIPILLPAPPDRIRWEQPSGLRVVRQQAPPSERLVDPSEWRWGASLERLLAERRDMKSLKMEESSKGRACALQLRVPPRQHQMACNPHG